MTITDTALGAKIVYGAQSITLEHVLAANVVETDFILAH